MKAGRYKVLSALAALAMPLWAWAQPAGEVESTEPVAWQLNMTQGVTHTSQMAYDAHMFALWVCVVIGVLVFTGLTAYDTQRIKEMYIESDGTAVMTKKAIMGALTLYLDFINLFLMLLRLFGSRD